MLADSLEVMREHVVQRFAAVVAACSPPADASGSGLRDLLPELLDDLSASLRRGSVDAAPPRFGGRGVGPQCVRRQEQPVFDPEAVVREYRLLGDCIHELVDERRLDVSPGEMRILSDWLTVRASAPALARAKDASELNRRFAALLDAVPDPIAAVHREGSLCYLNRAAVAVAHAASGVPIDEIVGRSWSELGYPSDLAREYGEHLAKASAGATVTTEVTFPTPNGARWFEHKLSPIYREDGTLVSVAAISRDIHDRKRAQTRLSLLSKLSALAGTLDYEEVLSAVARLSIPEFADCCIVDVLDERGDRRAVMAHRDPAKVPLVEAIRRFPLDHAARRRMPSMQALQSGRPVLIPHLTVEKLREWTDDREFIEVVRQIGTCSEIVIPVTLSSSLATMLFFLTAESGRRYGPEDVALAEELVRRAAQLVETAQVHQKLRQTEERFRIALAHSNITLFEQDAESRYSWTYNLPPGFHAADVLGKTNDDLFPPEEAARLNAYDRAVLRAGERIQDEVGITTPQGDTLHLLVSEEPRRDNAGAIVGLTGAATDISEQKRVQEELSQALTFREQMMGILGHDLRNPLGAVRVLASLLLRRQDLPTDVRESLSEIGRAGKRMLEMIGTLLDFTESRFKGSLPVAPVPTDIHEVCRGVVEELLAAEPGRIDMELEGDGRGTWDPARMAQVVSNLVANGLKHGASQGPVRVSVGRDEEDVVLKVTNQGPVIAPEVMAVLFEPFCRGSGPRDTSHARGLGLGLYIARQIVCSHGGAITVESSCEQGTTFTVRLPRAGGVRTAEAPRVPQDGGAAVGA